MVHYEGEKGFSAAPPEIWSKLSDARFLAGCVPNAEAVLRAESTIAEFKLRPGLSFVRGVLTVVLQVVEAEANKHVRYRAVGKGIGSGSTVEAAVTLAPHDAGTHAGWTVDVTELTGLLKAVPRGLIQASAQKVIDELWNSVADKLEN